MNQFTIKDPDNYCSKFFGPNSLKSTNQIKRQYIFDNALGLGSLEHIFIDNGIEIFLNEMTLHKDFEYKYTLEYSNFEIIYCIKGLVTYGDDRSPREHSIRAGDIKFLKNGTFNRWERFHTSEDWKSISICFNNKFLSQFQRFNMDNINDFDEKTFEPLLGERMTEIGVPEIKVAFNQIDKYNCQCDSICKMLYFQSKAIEIISLFIQNKLSEEYELNKEANLKPYDIDKIKYARELITNDFVNPLSINALSKYIGLNTFKLKVGFKQIYNTTIYGYIRDIRMEKAREYLIGSGKNVIEIANMVGYSNPSHFSVAFKKKYGVNPSELKKRYL